MEAAFRPSRSNRLKKLNSREILKYNAYKNYDFDNWIITRDEREGIISRIPDKKKYKT